MVCVWDGAVGGGGGRRFHLATEKAETILLTTSLGSLSNMIE